LPKSLPPTNPELPPLIKIPEELEEFYPEFQKLSKKHSVFETPRQTIGSLPKSLKEPESEPQSKIVEPPKEKPLPP
jgi:hypothetical protein